MATIYDSRAFVKRLVEAGMPEAQANTLADENIVLLAEHLATKDDLRALEASLHAKMGSLEARLVTRLGGLMAALLAAFAAVIKLL